MKTLIVLFTLAVIATATPVAFPKDVETFKLTNKLATENSQLYRQKKSSSLPIEEASSLTGQNIEDGLESTHFAEGRNLGIKKPIIIKKKFGYHHLRDSVDERETTDDCQNQVKVKVCNEETEPSADKIKPTFAGRNDMVMSEQEMENHIQMAKEAVENLHRDLHNIEKKSQKLSASRSDTELDSELHNNIEIARKALENIHQNFGNLEAMNLKDIKEEDSEKEKKTDAERFAQWKEAQKNIQKNIEIVRNIENEFKSNDPTKEMTSETFLINDDKNELGDLTDLNLMDKPRKDVDMTKSKTGTIKSSDDLEKETNMKMTTDTKIDTPVSQKLKPFEQGLEIEKSKNANDMIASEMNQTGDNTPMDNMAKLSVDNLMPSSSHLIERKEESNGMFEMTSNEPMEPNSRIMHDKKEPLINTWAQEKSTDDGKQKLFETLNMRLSENNGKKTDMSRLMDTSNPKNDVLENNLMRVNTDNNKNQEQMSQMAFKMSPTNMNQNLNLNNPLSSRVPMSMHGLHTPKQFENTELNFDQNNLNVFQNQDNSMMDVNQQQTAEDPFFMRWAVEQQRNNMAPHSNMMNLRSDQIQHMDDFHNMDAMNQFDMAANDDLSGLGPNMHDHDHMHIIHHPNMDSSMQSSMRMNMMTNMGKPMEYSGVQWANHGLARSSYGPSAAPSAPSSDSGPGAVGIFPNAKVGGCAIPILVSCSPSLATGSLAKTHPQPSYSAPGYRSGDNMVYYMKRDANLEDNLPILKVQRTLTPFNHKTELVLEETKQLNE